MKKIYKTLSKVGFILMVVGLASCTSYLDRPADSNVSQDAAFKNFVNFQGFIEQIYTCIPDKENMYYTTSWNWGDDEVFNTEGSWHTTSQFDLGNFWAWQSEFQSQSGCWFDKASVNPSNNDRMSHALWSHAWYCIRKCNLGLENLSKMTDATDQEKALIAGQLYFFRAWWHFEAMEYLGGLPYVDKVLSPSETLTLPRLSYKECADKVAADFRKAADLLPVDWDTWDRGKATLGKNQLRINKIMALGYLGKNYLWAGSPLQKNGAQLGAIASGKTYVYDADYCKKAADAFGELLAEVETKPTPYSLAQFKYQAGTGNFVNQGIYNHTKAADATSCFSEIFVTMGQGWKHPGSTEAIFRGISPGANSAPYRMAQIWGPKYQQIVEGDNIIHQPTANYVNYYGMANGLPLNDPNSGFDPTRPFKNRDPRFYHDIVFDGFKYINGSLAAADEQYRYVDLKTNGISRGANNGSKTGYFIQKLAPHTNNRVDQAYSYGSQEMCYLPYMRLGDIYLMYAEACAAIGGASTASTTYTGLTAEKAINTIRDRCGAGHVAASYVADPKKFMDEIRRERAVELSFEGFRFNDLQRWLLLTEYPYTVKTSQEFDRVENSTFYTTNDPKDARVSSFREVVFLTRPLGVKHYWLPMKIKDVSLYSGFDQNPGW
jgi:hypothetical protein